jgi:hypothetical protein
MLLGGLGDRQPHGRPDADAEGAYGQGVLQSRDADAPVLRWDRRLTPREAEDLRGWSRVRLLIRERRKEDLR